MEIRLIDEAEDDLVHWEKTHNSLVLKRISELFTSMLETPTKGIGKPEALRHGLSGYWSRRIDKTNRIVYRIEDDIIWIISLKGHYR
jgi:toxin YoeB